jgi:hypothetical protein
VRPGTADTFGSLSGIKPSRCAHQSNKIPECDSALCRLCVAVVASGALAALGTVAVIRAMPGLVDVGFLGWRAFALPVRLALHLPLAVVVLATGLAALLLTGAHRHWWTTRIRPYDATLAGALTALAVQLALWHLVAWGF